MLSVRENTKGVERDLKFSPNVIEYNTTKNHKPRFGALLRPLRRSRKALRPGLENVMPGICDTDRGGLNPRLSNRADAAAPMLKI